MVALAHYLEEEEEMEKLVERVVELLWEVPLRVEEEGNQMVEVVGTNLEGKVKSQLEEGQ